MEVQRLKFEVDQLRGIVRNLRTQVESGLEYERGQHYYNSSASVLYLVFGVDGSWEAIEWDGTDAYTTGPYQTGTKPSTVMALPALTYTTPYVF